MRQIVIDRIRNSRKWDLCIKNGLELELPILEVQTDTELLELYEYYYC